jgi:hypothetical protein
VQIGKISVPNFVQIRNLFSTKFCANTKFFQFEICSKFKICSKFNFFKIPNLFQIQNLFQIRNLFELWNLFKLNFCTSKICLNRKKRKGSIHVGLKWLGPVGGRSQAGANRSLNKGGIAPPDVRGLRRKRHHIGFTFQRREVAPGRRKEGQIGGSY